MNNRPTPETDASIIERRHIHKSDGSVQLVELIDAEFARRLERELNEAMEALDCLLTVIGLTPIAGNKEALQEAFDQCLAILRKKEETK